MSFEIDWDAYMENMALAVEVEFDECPDAKLYNKTIAQVYMECHDNFTKDEMMFVDAYGTAQDERYTALCAYTYRAGFRDCVLLLRLLGAL